LRAAILILHDIIITLGALYPFHRRFQIAKAVSNTQVNATHGIQEFVLLSESVSGGCGRKFLYLEKRLCA
jgi:hypothetical protein